MQFSQPANYPDLVCLSHLRWSFVFQRPQHLMSRFARTRRVFFIEEPVFDASEPRLTMTLTSGVHVVVPHLPAGLRPADSTTVQQRLINGLFYQYGIERPTLWFYTPMAQALVDGMPHDGIAYDCMDDLSGFANAPAEMKAAERSLLSRADIVFTGGQSLYEARKTLHPNVHAFPSSVDVAHFRRARTVTVDPADQRDIPRPRLGFCGVIDERMNLDLVRQVAARSPQCHIVMIGPVVKIDPNDLPRLPNIHYLGLKPYDQLPEYFGGWDVALMPFAHNAATRYISPTKTPEYLAAGLPVVSTSIEDVVHPYGDRGCVAIADTGDEFCAAVARALTPEGLEDVRRARPLLARMSWNATFAGMQTLLNQTLSDSTAPRPPAVVATRAATAVQGGV
jgi:glycosyltransferase involved in cell wall biosynthesis